jgi:hypothetical protein
MPPMAREVLSTNSQLMGYRWEEGSRWRTWPDVSEEHPCILSPVIVSNCENCSSHKACLMTLSHQNYQAQGLPNILQYTHGLSSPLNSMGCFDWQSGLWRTALISPNPLLAADTAWTRVDSDFTVNLYEIRTTHVEVLVSAWKAGRNATITTERHRKGNLFRSWGTIDLWHKWWSERFSEISFRRPHRGPSLVDLVLVI